MAERCFTTEELRRYNGTDGAPAYVAYRGKVYDVTTSFLWRNGRHRQHRAGEDLTLALDNEAPHGRDWLEKFPVVGTLAQD
ncbi:MAG: cytochrome b5 domain-containing protein [Chloroflexota bacterium]